MTSKQLDLTQFEGHTPGDWGAFTMTNAETGADMTPADIGEYVTNAVRKSEEESGSTDYLFVSVDKDDGPSDVCHVGNGPDGPRNAQLIAAAPSLLALAREQDSELAALRVRVEELKGAGLELLRDIDEAIEIDSGSFLVDTEKKHRNGVEDRDASELAYGQNEERRMRLERFRAALSPKGEA